VHLVGFYYRTHRVTDNDSPGDVIFVEMLMSRNLMLIGVHCKGVLFVTCLWRLLSFKL